MKKLTLALACCAAFALAAQEPTVATIQVPSGAAMAATLPALERYAPEVHRLLADGTFDTMSFDQRFTVLDDFLSDMAARIPGGAERVAQSIASRREMIEAGVDPETEAWLNRMFFRVLRGMNDAFSDVQRAGITPDQWQQYRHRNVDGLADR